MNNHPYWGIVRSKRTKYEKKVVYDGFVHVAGGSSGG